MENQKTITSRATGLTKKFGDFTAVNEIDFEIYQGEIFGFLGPNGSGKTTTIRMMLGLLEPTAGSAEILGMEVNGNIRALRSQIGYMSQRFSLYNDLTVLQNLEFYGAAYGLENSGLKARVDEALDMAGLVGKEHTQTKNLSGGWRQRLALSAAILHRPKVLFLDEPTAGVDPISRRAFWDLLYHLIAQEITVFVTTHYMDEAEHCHRMAFIQRGNIIAYGTPDEIKQEKMNGEVLEIVLADAPEGVRALRTAMQENAIPLEDVQLYGSLIHAILPSAKKHEGAIKKILKQAGTPAQQISLIEPSLEDVFIASMESE